MSPAESDDESLGGGYPSLHLTHEHLQKLGIKGAQVGDKFHIHAHGHVTSVSQHEGNEDAGPTGHVGMDLHKMLAEPAAGAEEGGEDKAVEGARAAMDQALKPKSKKR